MAEPLHGQLVMHETGEILIVAFMQGNMTSWCSSRELSCDLNSKIWSQWRTFMPSSSQYAKSSDSGSVRKNHGKHLRMFAWSFRKHGWFAHICLKLKLQLKGNRNWERTDSWSIEEMLKPITTTANLVHQDDLLRIHLKSCEKMKPPSTTLRNVSHSVSSQPDIPLLGKRNWTFTAAKDHRKVFCKTSWIWQRKHLNHHANLNFTTETSPTSS